MQRWAHQEAPVGALKEYLGLPEASQTLCAYVSPVQL